MLNVKRTTTTRILVSIACVTTCCRVIGCAEAEEFRAVAGDTIQNGVQTIATGLIDGLFAVIEPDDLIDDNNS